MQQIEFGEQLNCPIVMCLGYFGCMHRGHIRLVEEAKARARQYGAKTAMFTFSNNHLAVLGREEKVLYTFDERLSLYESLGVDVVITTCFDANFMRTTGGEFVERLKRYDLKCVVCGFDYSYGSDRQDAADLRKALSDTCETEIVGAVCVDGVKVSTTLVRSLLLQNRIVEANSVLSEPFFIRGAVAHGRHKGSEMGFPTANISVDKEKFVPTGVFGGQVESGGSIYRAIINAGQKPTFGLANADVEAHLIGFCGNLYGREIKMSLTRYLRPIYKFDNEAQLIKQLQADREKVLND